MTDVHGPIPPGPGGAEEDLQQARVVEAVARLSGTVAHEFNNLLTAILGHAQLLAETLPADSRDLDSVREILAAGDRATALTRTLVASGRRRPPQPREFDLAAAVREALPLVMAALEPAHRVETRIAVEPAVVRADRGEVEQVLVALAANASAAMAGAGTLTVALDATGAAATDAPPRTVRLRVIDDGAGLSPAARAHLFEPFFTTRPRGRGLGLGLALAKATMTRAGGTIRVGDAPGRGTEVTLTFPLAADAAAAP
jgi:two-component system, cell cycle sensor histidine kinase and response regulator CckA